MSFPINIVIFGCDNSGKTTLAKALCSEFEDSRYVRSLGPNKTFNEQIKFMLDNLDVDRVNIFDRFPCIEENVCGNVLRGVDNFSGLDISIILDKVDLFIFCYPGLKSVLNWGDREQLIGVKENVVGLINGYNKYAYKLIQNGYRVEEYNYNTLSFIKEWVKYFGYIIDGIKYEKEKNK